MSFERLAYHGILWGDGAFPTQPLALRYIGHTIAVYGKLSQSKS